MVTPKKTANIDWNIRSRLTQFAKSHNTKKNRKIATVSLNFLLIFALLFTSFFLNSTKVRSATYTWDQTDWSGGEDSNARANHTDQMDNAIDWTRYYSATNLITNVAGEVSMEPTNVLRYDEQSEFERDDYAYSNVFWNTVDDRMELTQQGKVTSTGFYESPIIRGWDVDPNIDWSEIRWDEKLNKRASFKGFVDGNLEGEMAVVPDDLDEDGDIDVIVISQIPNSMVGWYENNGEEGYTLNHIDDSTIDNSGYLRGGYRVKVLDFDNDGDKDVVASGVFSNKIRWYENDGEENFTAHDSITNVSNVRGFDIYDLDGQNGLDVVAALEGTDDIVYFLNDGSMNFSGPNYIEMNLDGAYDVRVGFVNSDSYVDVVGVGYYADDIKWYQNNGSLSFSPHDIDLNVDGPVQLDILDIDNDSDNDIFLAAESQGMIMYENDGSSTPSFTYKLLDGTTSNLKSFYVDDLDLDSDKDISIVSSVSGEVAYLENDGSTQFTKNIVASNFANGNYIGSTDIDGDGDVDMLGGSNNGQITWWENDFGSFKNVFNDVSDPSVPFTGAKDALPVDFDADGDVDVVAVAITDDEVAWWENDGNENFTKHVIATAIDSATSVSVGDLDNANGLDVVVTSFNQDELLWFQNDGAFNFTKYSISSSYAGANDVYVADVNGDGNLDIISTAANGNTIDWWENDGAIPPTFAKRDIDNTDSRVFNGAAEAIGVDIDGDLDIDIIGSARYNDDVEIWINDGSPVPNFNGTVLDGNFDGAFGLSVSDYEGDGDLDVFATAPEANTIAFWENQGGGVFGPTNIIESSFSKASRLDAKDIDEDGDSDIVASSEDLQEFAWWTNNGDGTFDFNLIKADARGASSVYIVDVDGDENYDIVTSSIYENKIEWYRNKQTFSDIKIQVRAGNDPNLWTDADYVGPNGQHGDCSITDVNLPYCYSDPGGGDLSTVLPDSQYFQYRVYFTTTGSTITSELFSVEIEATNAIGYELTGELVSSMYNAEDEGNVMADIFWDEADGGAPPGTHVKAQIRTAPDDGNGNPGTWTPWKGPTDENDYYTDPTGNLILDEFSDAGASTPEDQWFQARFILESNVYSAPKLNGTHIKYVINDPPQITFQNTQDLACDSPPYYFPSICESIDRSVNGENMNIDYTVWDVDVGNPDPQEDDVNSDIYMFVDIGLTLASSIDKVETSEIPILGDNFNFLPNSGTIMIDREIIEYTSKSSGVNNTVQTLVRGAPSVGYSSRPANHLVGAKVWMKVNGANGDLGRVQNDQNEIKNIKWNIDSDLPDFYKSDASIRVVGIDKNAAKQVGYSDIGPMPIDTKEPVYGLVTLNSRTDNLTILATDDSPMEMRLSNVLSNDPTPIPTSDGTNADSGDWIPYATSKSWIPEDLDSDGVETVYIQFRDVYGNESQVFTIDTPQAPTDLLIQDASNPATSDWRLFVSWGVVPEPSSGFASYNLYRSTDEDTFTDADLIMHIPDRQRNYYIDNDPALDSDTMYYYRVSSTDVLGNESNFNTKGSGTTGEQINSDLGLVPDGSGGGDFATPVISNIQVTNITSTTAEITWDTDVLSDSLVSYTLTNDGTYEMHATDPSIVTSHSVLIENLDPDTQYFFKVKSTTPFGKYSEEEDPLQYNFTTLADSQAPDISNVFVTTTINSAVITWSTDEPSTSQVFYDTTDDGTFDNSLPEDSTMVYGHSMEITGLSANTQYFYRVVSVDEAGNSSADNPAELDDEGSFITTEDPTDITPPIINNNQPISVVTTSNSAQLSWSTNEDSISWVEYGTGGAVTRGEITDTDTLKQNFNLTIPGLDENTTYDFTVVAVDGSGNRSQTSLDNFTTLIEAPTIVDLDQIVNNNSAGIVWTTSEPTTGYVEYGTSPAYGNTTPIDTSLKIGHIIQLNGLNPNTQYHYKVVSEDAQLTSVESPDQTFTTTAASSDTTSPVISNVQITSVTTNSAQISWDTNESTIGWVAYGPDVNYGSGAINDNVDFATSFSLSLGGLTDDTLYHLKVYAIDSSGNKGESQDYTFITLKADDSGGLDSGGSSGSNPPKIEGGTSVSQITFNSVLLRWLTDKAGSSSVIYKPKNKNGQTVEISNKGESTKDHSVRIVGLQPNTLYEYQVKTVASDGSSIVSDPSEFRTNIKPVIADVSVDIGGYDKVAITWASNLSLTTEINYGNSPRSYTKNVTKTDGFSNLHRVELAGLGTGSTYYFQILGRDQFGNIVTSDEYNFSTKTPPSITNVVVEQVGKDSVTVKYKTSKEVKSKIEYKNTQTGEIFSVADEKMDTKHSVDIKSLVGGVKYDMYIVISDDGDQGEEYRSQLYTFSTKKDSEGPIISSVKTKATILEGSNPRIQAIFTWNTDEKSTSSIEFIDASVELPENMDELEKDMVINHTIVISTLKPSTVYKYQLISTDEDGNTTRSDTYVLLTPAQSVSVIDLIINNLEDVFGWTNNLR